LLPVTRPTWKKVADLNFFFFTFSDFFGNFLEKWRKIGKKNKCGKKLEKSKIKKNNFATYLPGKIFGMLREANNYFFLA